MTSPFMAWDNSNHACSDNDRDLEQRHSLYRKSSMFQEDDFYEVIVHAKSTLPTKKRFNRWGEEVEEKTPRKGDWDRLNDSLSLLHYETECRAIDTIDYAVRPRAASTSDLNDSQRSLGSNSSLTHPTRTLSSSQTMEVPQERRVRFSTTTVREYKVAIGDSPSCSGPCALTLDWEFAPPRTEKASALGAFKGGRVKRLSVSQRRERIATVLGLPLQQVKLQEVERMLEAATAQMEEADSGNVGSLPSFLDLEDLLQVCKRTKAPSSAASI